MTTEPVIRNSSSRVASADDDGGDRQPGPEPGLDVGELGGGTADLHVERGAVGADPVDQRGRGGPLAGAGRDEVDDGQCRRGCRAGSTVPATPARAGDVGHPRRGGRVGRVDGGDDGDRVGAAGREPVREDEGGGARLGRAGQGAGVAVLEPRAQERGAEQHEDGGDGAADDDRPALHPAGEPVEAALDVRRRRQGLDAPADHGQRRGQQGDGGGHAQQDDGEAGDAERGEQRHAEDEQAGHGDRDGERGEHDGGAGGGDGGDSGVVHVAAVAALLAEPVDHQQPVVDARARCPAC